MNLEDIIKELNYSIEGKRECRKIKSNSTLILHKSIMPHETMKAFKTIKICLWYVENNMKYRVLNMEHTRKILKGQEEEAIEEASKTFLSMLFDLIGSSFYEKIVKGEYGKVEVS